MTHQPTVTKNYKNTQSEFDSYLGSCDVSVAPRAVRLSTSSGTQLLLLPKGNSRWSMWPIPLTGPSRHGLKSKLRQHFLDETVTRPAILDNGWEAKLSIRGNGRKLEIPLGAPRVTE